MKLNLEHIDAILDCRREGLTQNEILLFLAIAFGLKTTQPRISQILKKYGDPQRAAGSQQRTAW